MLKKNITLKDVAEKSGVSITSVSIILNKTGNYKRMSQQTRRKVERVANELGYQTNYLAKALRQRKTMQIGLVIPNMYHMFMPLLTTGGSEIAKQYGYNFLLLDMTDKTDAEVREIIKTIQRAGIVDGLLIDALGDILYDVATEVPVVYIDSFSTKPSVCFTEFQSTYDLTELFIKQGLRKIAYIGGNNQRESIYRREQGFRKAMKDYGVMVDEKQILRVSCDIAGGLKAFDWVMEMMGKPEAIISCTDSVTHSLQTKLINAGIQVPRDIAIASVDDLEFSQVLKPAITCSHVDAKEMGRKATKLLIDILNGEDVDETQTILVPTRMIIRESSKKFNFERGKKNG